MAPPDLSISSRNGNEGIAACQIFSEVLRKFRSIWVGFCMRGPPRHLSALFFDIGLGVLASIVGDQRRHRVRWLAGQPFKDRSERKGLGM